MIQLLARCMITCESRKKWIMDCNISCLTASIDGFYERPGMGCVFIAKSPTRGTPTYKHNHCHLHPIPTPPPWKMLSASFEAYLSSSCFALKEIDLLGWRENVTLPETFGNSFSSRFHVPIHWFNIRGGAVSFRLVQNVGESGPLWSRRAGLQANLLISSPSLGRSEPWARRPRFVHL